MFERWKYLICGWFMWEGDTKAQWKPFGHVWLLGWLPWAIREAAGSHRDRTHLGWSLIIHFLSHACTAAAWGLRTGQWHPSARAPCHRRAWHWGCRPGALHWAGTRGVGAELDPPECLLSQDPDPALLNRRCQLPSGSPPSSPAFLPSQPACSVHFSGFLC